MRVPAIATEVTLRGGKNLRDQIRDNCLSLFAPCSPTKSKPLHHSRAPVPASLFVQRLAHFSTVTRGRTACALPNGVSSLCTSRVYVVLSFGPHSEWKQSKNQSQKRISPAPSCVLTVHMQSEMIKSKFRMFFVYFASLRGCESVVLHLSSTS